MVATCNDARRLLVRQIFAGEQRVGCAPISLGDMPAVAEASRPRVPSSGGTVRRFSRKDLS
jgi:hypothetical protein